MAIPMVSLFRQQMYYQLPLSAKELPQLVHSGPNPSPVPCMLCYVDASCCLKTDAVTHSCYVTKFDLTQLGELC